MAKPIFNLHKNGAQRDGAEVIRKLETQKEFDFQIIPREKLRHSSKNHFKPDKIAEIKESIKQYGLFHNILVIKVDDLFEVLSGNTRLIAIDELNKEGNERYKAGIPCRILPPDTPEIDQEIIIEEANLRVRDDAEQFRIAIERLNKLYKRKNEESNTNVSITKQIAEQAGISERQVQKYNVINNKLIHKLKEELDNGNISVNYAAEIAALSEETQKILFDLLIKKEAKTKEELEKLKNQAIVVSNNYKNEIEKINETIENSKSENNTLKQNIFTKDKEIEDKNQKIQEILKELEEVKNSIHDNLKEKELEDEIKILESKRADDEKQKTKLLEITKAKETEIKNLKKKLENMAKHPSTEISESEKQKITAKYELENVFSDVKKTLKHFQIKAEHYQRNYSDLEREKYIQEIEKFYQSILKL